MAYFDCFPFSMRSRHITVVVLASLASGCSYLDPYVLPKASKYCGDVIIDVAKSDACTDLSATREAVNKAQENADETSKKVVGIGGTVNVNRALGLATFGLVTAAAARTAGEASTAATRNLALGAGATYAATNLFAQPSTEALYMASYTSMICITNKGNKILANYDAAITAYKDAESDDNVRSFLNECQTYQSLPADIKNEINNLNDAKRAASVALVRTRSMDASIASAVRSASNNVLFEMNKQLLSQSPSIDAIFQAGKSGTTIASGLMQSGTAKTTLGTLGLCEKTIEVSTLQQVTSQYKGVTDLLAQTLNEVGSLSTGCVTTPAVTTQPLAVNQTTVVLDPGTTSTLVVTGGTIPYQAKWLGQPPNDSEQLKKGDFDQSGRLTVTEISTDKDLTFTLEISDSAVVPHTLQVKVNIHAVAAKPAAPAKAVAPVKAGAPAKAAVAAKAAVGK